MRGSLISFLMFTIALYNVKYTKYTTKVQQNHIKSGKKNKLLINADFFVSESSERKEIW